MTNTKCELSRTTGFFEVAIPNPTESHKCIQLGVHIEEIAEMFDALRMKPLALRMHSIAGLFKRCDKRAIDIIRNMDTVEFFDSILDQNVTGNGACYMFDLPLLEGLAEVNRANYSKFEDGKPVFDKNGKITKGVNYSGPDLKTIIDNHNEKR